MRKNVVFVGALLLSVVAQGQEPDFNKVEIKAQKVAGSVYMLEGAGGNIAASIGEDGIVVIDDQFAPLADKIKAALKNISDQPIRFIINTHYHGDHTGGNAAFSKEGTIIAQENVRKRLAEGSSMKRLKRTTPPAGKDALPLVTFNDRATLHLNGEEIRAIHLPHGHTDGDSVIFFTKSNVVHMGDDFVTYGFPFVDVENGGSVSGMIAGCEKVLGMVPADAKFIPGHDGGVFSGEDVRKFINLLKETRAIVEAAAKKGMKPAEMKKEKILAKYDAQYGRDFIKTDDWIDVLYQDVIISGSR